MQGLLYIIKLTVPPNTPASSPTKVTLDWLSGDLYKISFLWPRNAGGFLFARFKIGMIRIPVEAQGCESYMTAEQTMIDYPLPKPYTLAAGEEITLEGYNLDTTYEHSVYLYLWIEEVGEWA